MFQYAACVSGSDGTAALGAWLAPADREYADFLEGALSTTRRSSSFR
jgi:hypothetical protein